MPRKAELTTKASEPEKVDAYMGRLKHLLAKVVEDLRQIILSTDKEIGEEIKWNAPTFFTVGAWSQRIRRSTEDISWYSICSSRIASGWFFRAERRSKILLGNCKATTRTEEGWRCFTTGRT